MPPISTSWRITSEKLSSVRAWPSDGRPRGAVQPNQFLTALVGPVLVAHAAERGRSGYRFERLGADRDPDHALKPLGLLWPDQRLSMHASPSSRIRTGGRFSCSKHRDGKCPRQLQASPRWARTSAQFLCPVMSIASWSSTWIEPSRRRSSTSDTHETTCSTKSRAFALGSRQRPRGRPT